MRLDDPADLLALSLQSLYSMETQLVLALPRVAARAQDESLRNMLEGHLEQTHAHAERLEQAADMIGIDCNGRRSLAMEGILRDGDEMLGHGGDAALTDSAIITACQAVEHHEIAAYTATHRIASAMALTEVARLLETTLSEENQALATLKQLADRVSLAAPRPTAASSRA